MTKEKTYDKITTVINNSCYVLNGEILPAKKIVNREEIINAAVEIVSESGIGALNMRTLAKRCNCSTQPIYLSFENAEELKNQTAIKALEIFNDYLQKEIAEGKFPEYKAVDMGYIRFAKEKKELFKFLLMNDGMEKTGLANKSFDDSVFMIMQNYGLYRGDASKLHLQMWVFIHGIASMFATDYSDFNWDFVSQMVTDAYKAFFSRLQEEKKEKNDN